MTPAETVNAFIAAVTSGDRARAAELAADDILYENIGFGPASLDPALPTIQGAQAMLDFLAAMEDADWTVHREQTLGTVVVNERTDRFKFGGKQISIPVAGVFEVLDGKITFWRDYFETQLMVEQMS